MKIINELNNNAPFTVGCDCMNDVETVAFADKNKIYLSAVQVKNEEQLFEISPFKLQIYTDKTVKSVKHLPDEKQIEYSQSDGKLEFVIENLRILEMYEIETL